MYWDCRVIRNVHIYLRSSNTLQSLCGLEIFRVFFTVAACSVKFGSSLPLHPSHSSSSSHWSLSTLPPVSLISNTHLNPSLFIPLISHPTVNLNFFYVLLISHYKFLRHSLCAHSFLHPAPLFHPSITDPSVFHPQLLTFLIAHLSNWSLTSVNSSIP